MSFVFPKLPRTTRKNYLPRHIYFGLAGLILATVAVLTGLIQKMWLKQCGETLSTSEGIVISSIIILVILFSILVCLLATDKNFKRISLPQNKAIDQGTGAEVFDYVTWHTILFTHSHFDKSLWRSMSQSIWLLK